MNTKNLTKRKIFSSFFSGILILSFVFTPISHTFTIKTVSADADDAANIAHTVQGTITAGASVIEKGLMFALKIKEFSLDAIAWGLVNIMIKEMIRATTAWVNRGFEGSPAFVTNFGEYMTGIGDKVAGNFLWGAGGPLKALCSPFALDIKLALELQYRDTRGGAYEAQCTLSGVVDNMNNFLSGDFLEGGWDGWYQLTQNPKNNPYGALLEAQSGLTIRILGEEYKSGKLLDFGKGFFSMKDPRCKPDPANPDDFDETKCNLVTPGTAIESSLNTALAGGMRRLEVADELNELIGALFAQLAKEVLGGVGGLLGSTRSGGAFDGISKEPDPSDPGAGGSVFEDILKEERDYLDLITKLVDMIKLAQSYWKDTYSFDDRNPRTAKEQSCYEASVEEFPASLLQELTAAEWERTTASTTIKDIEQLQTDLATLDDTEAEPSVIAAILTRYAQDSIPKAKQEILKQFTSYQSSGVLHTMSEYVELKLTTIPRIEKVIADYMSDVDDACTGGGSDNN